jgi:peptidoglycan/LPS O-acetylase OafA/YrhL
MSGRIRQLDGVRGIAILLVVLHNESHMFPSLHLNSVFADGWMGVDLFFVLSGFLITGILFDAKGTERYLANFYARRCLRIWPLYFSLLVFMFAVVPWLRPSDAHLVFERSSPWWAYPLFLQNFLVPVSTAATGPLGVTWSLAIEEQFYVIWPWVVRAYSPKQLRRLAVVVMCASPIMRLYLSSMPIDQYSNVFCRLDGLMAGAVLATVIRDRQDIAGGHEGLAWIALSVALALALIGEMMRMRWLVYSLSALASLALVYLALFSSNRILAAILTNRVLVYTGTISYGLYLLHKLPFDVAKDRPPAHPAAIFALLLVADYAVASASWFVLERPILRLKRFFAFQSPGRMPLPWLRATT